MPGRVGAIARPVRIVARHLSGQRRLGARRNRDHDITRNARPGTGKPTLLVPTIAIMDTIPLYRRSVWVTPTAEQGRGHGACLVVSHSRS